MMNAKFLRLKPFSSRLLCASLLYSSIPGSRDRSWAKIHAESSSTEPWDTEAPVITTPRGQSQQRENARQPSSNDGPKAGDSVESRDDDFPLFEDEESAAWASFSSRFARVRESLTAIRWSSLGGKMADHVLPDWAQMLPDYVTKLQTEMGMGADSLAHIIWVCDLRTSAFIINSMLPIKFSESQPKS